MNYKYNFTLKSLIKKYKIFKRLCYIIIFYNLQDILHFVFLVKEKKANLLT